MIFRKILPYAFLLLNLGYRYVSKFVLTHFSVELSKMECKFSFFKRLVHRKLFEISGKIFLKGRNETNDISRPYTLNADQQMMIAFAPNKTVIPLVFCFVHQEEIIRKHDLINTRKLSVVSKLGNCPRTSNQQHRRSSTKLKSKLMDRLSKQWCTSNYERFIGHEVSFFLST